MGTHATNLAKLKIQTAQQHLKMALASIKDEKADKATDELINAESELVDARALLK